MTSSLCQICLQAIMEVVFVILDWIFVLKNTTTKIPCKRISLREKAFMMKSKNGQFEISVILCL